MCNQWISVYFLIQSLHKGKYCGLARNSIQIHTHGNVERWRIKLTPDFYNFCWFSCQWRHFRVYYGPHNQVHQSQQKKLLMLIKAPFWVFFPPFNLVGIPIQRNYPIPTQITEWTVALTIACAAESSLQIRHELRIEWWWRDAFIWCISMGYRLQKSNSRWYYS